MRQPQFLFEEFLDNNALNTAMTEVLQSIYAIGSNVNPFFTPGVINGANGGVNNIVFTFNNNLTVTVNPQNSPAVTNPSGCLFGTGVIATSHGTTPGTDASSVTVNFAPLVPGAGSITAYVVASSGQVQLDSSTIIGPPPGHPDFSANFLPYIGYTRLEDTLIITTTTTTPDNVTNIELGRTTLTNGQTVVSTIDTTHQVPAGLNAKTVTLGGDVTGVSSANIISNLQGKPVNATAPALNNLLLWNGTAWVPSGGGPAGGDLSGSYPNPVVVKSSNSTFTIAGTFLAPEFNIQTSGFFSNPGSSFDQFGNIIVNTVTSTNTISSTNGNVYSGGSFYNPAFGVDVNGNGSFNGVVAVNGLGPQSFAGLTAGGNIVAGNRFVGNTVSGSSAFAANHALLLGQFIPTPSVNSFLTQNGAIGVPIWNGSAIQTFILQWGFVSWVNQSANTKWSSGLGSDAVGFNVAFPNACIWGSACLTSNDNTAAGAMIGQSVLLEIYGPSYSTTGMTVLSDYVTTTGSVTTTIAQSSGALGLTGFTWMALGY